MEKDKIVILTLVAVILCLLVGLAAVMSDMNRKDTVLAFKSGSTLKEGDLLEIALCDNEGNAVANQTLGIRVTGGKECSINTDRNGIAAMEIDLSPGEYNVTVSYDGSDGYASSSADETITVEDEPAVFNDTYVERQEGNLVYGYKEGRYGFWTPSGNFIEDKSRALSGQDPSEPFTRDGDFYSQL